METVGFTVVALACDLSLSGATETIIAGPLAAGRTCAICANKFADRGVSEHGPHASIAAGSNIFMDEELGLSETS
ncbi:MAG: hypothetical protein ABIA59_03455 [Candidatus Latescibacterota bacterium]